MTVIGLFLNNEMRTGANRRYLELMEGLASRGNRVFVLMNANLPYAPTSFTRIELDVRYKRKGFPPASFLFARAIRKALPALAAHIGEGETRESVWVHIHGDLHLKAALIIRKRLGARLFFAYRCNDIKRAHILRESGQLSAKDRLLSLAYEAMNRVRERQVASFAELVTFQNADDRDEFVARTGYSPENTVIIPGNIGLPRFTEEFRNINASDRLRRLVYVGTLSVSKGFRYALEALAELVKRGHRDITLTVLGKINEGDGVYEMVDILGIRSNVVFEGFKLPFPFFAAADLMIYPTLYDAFPDTVLEALHAGCPVIASAVGGIPDILSYGELTFEPSNVTGIADTIEKCILDADYYLYLKGLCAERAEVFRFDWPERFEESMRKAR